MKVIKYLTVTISVAIAAFAVALCLISRSGETISHKYPSSSPIFAVSFVVIGLLPQLKRGH